MSKNLRSFPVIASAAKQSRAASEDWIASSQVLLAMTTGDVLVQLLDRHRHALADADAHGGERALAAALFHAVHRGHRQPRSAHPERMAKRNGAAMRIDEIGIVLDPELAQAGDALRGKSLVELDQVEIADLEAQPLHQLA